MASSSLTVYLGSTELRKYGGTRADVRRLREEYAKMSYEDFLKLHPRVREEEFADVHYIVRYNKRSKGGPAFQNATVPQFIYPFYLNPTKS